MLLSSGDEELVLPHGGERLRHLVELRVVVLVVRHGGQRLGGLGVHVVEQPTTLSERHTHRDVVVEVEDDHGFDVTLLVCTIDRAGTGWSMTNKDEGFTDDMVTVARKAGVKF